MTMPGQACMPDGNNFLLPTPFDEFFASYTFLPSPNGLFYTAAQPKSASENRIQPPSRRVVFGISQYATLMG